MVERRPLRPPSPRRAQLARLISIAAHPFVLVPLTVALVTRNWRWTLIVAASTILPIFAIILWKVRRGVWSDVDVSHREQRSSLYWFAIPLFAAAAFLVPAPPWFMRSMLAICAVLVIGLAGDRFLKTSLHMLFGAYCAVILAETWPWSLAIVAVILGALAWSRWLLGHHTPAELAAGTVLGAAAGMYTVGS